MDPLMGIVGSLLVAKWSLGLLKQTSRALLDHQVSPAIVDTLRQKVEANGSLRVTDLHVWSIGPGIHSVIVSVLSQTQVSPDSIRELFDNHEYPHVTVEVQIAD